jgi:tRNA A-37 threonylcarbamoyl transferase component Bud32
VTNIKTLIDERIKKEPNIEIFSIESDNQKIWVKRARKTSSNLLHHLAYTLTKNPILIPVENKNPQEALKFESSKLQELYSLCIPVPKVIQVSKEYFLIEDRGPTVHYLVKNDLLENPTKLFEDIVTQLANLHNLGKFHGGSQIKNFTYKNDTIYFIDFEESFNRDIEIKELQFRDLFLFLFSISKLDIEVDYERLIKKYIALTKNKDIIQKFHTLTSTVSFLIKIVENRIVWSFIDRDTKSVYRLLEKLKSISSQAGDPE